MARQALPRPPRHPMLVHKTTPSASVLLLAIGVVLASAVLPYASTLTDYFIGDDFGLIQLLSSKPPLHVLNLFTNPWTELIYGGPYDELRPFVALSYQVDSVFGAARPLGYHADNLIAHAINALLVMTLGRVAAGLEWRWATLAGVLFGVLPAHAEAVAWISGRADLIPAAFSLGTLVAYAVWRAGGGVGAYVGTFVLLFAALFSKQSAITLLPAIVLYDVTALGRNSFATWRSVGVYAPFTLLTLGYLGLRVALFSHAVREDQLSASSLINFIGHLPGYLSALVLSPQELFTERPSLLRASTGLALGLLIVPLSLVVEEVRATADGLRGQLLKRMLYFGPLWLGLGIVPLLVVTYFSARHLYLASAGYTIVAAMCLQLLARRRFLAATTSATIIVLAFVLALRPALSDWRRAAAYSESISRVARTEAAALPTGALLLIDAPHVSPRTYTWVWAFALPFALQPPFVAVDFSDRIAIAEAPDIYCCSRQQWYGHVRAAIDTWSTRPDAPPVVLLHWNDDSETLERISEADAASLRQRVLTLQQSATPEQMQHNFVLLTTRLN